MTDVTVDIPEVLIRLSDESEPTEYIATVIGHGRDDIERGMVRLKIGPAVIDISREDLARALRVFE